MTQDDEESSEQPFSENASGFSVKDPFSRDVSADMSKNSLKDYANGRASIGSNNYNIRGSSKGGFQSVDSAEMKAVFVDAAAMKEKVRNRLCKPVVDYYKERGCAQRIVRSSFFEQATLAVIAFNAIWIAVDTDYNSAQMLLDAHPVFQVAEHVFCSFFSFEWTVRFVAFQNKRATLYDKWFCFDSVLVMLMVAETWVLTFWALTSGSQGGGGLGNASVLRVARLLRLTRMARMARLLRAMPELMILVKGMVAAMRSVFFTLLLLVIVMYVFGIGFTQMLSETDIGSKFFRNVPESMYTLLIYGTLLDNVGTMANQLGSESYFFTGTFFIFILLAALTVMNMLIGVLCEVVSAVAATEREEMLVNYVNRKVRKIVEELDSDGGGTISRDEFVQILDNNDAIRALQDVGVDVVGLVDFADVIFEDDEDLSFSRFMEVVLQLRGSNNATVKDVVDLRKLVRSELRFVTEAVNRLETRSFQWSETHQMVRRLSVQPARPAKEDIPRPTKQNSKDISLDSEALSYTNLVKKETVWNDYTTDEAKDRGLPCLVQASARTTLLRQNTSDSLQSATSQVAIPCESDIYPRHMPHHDFDNKGKEDWTPFEVTNLKGNGHWIPYDAANLIRPSGFQGMASTANSWDNSSSGRPLGGFDPSFAILQEAAQIHIKDVMCGSHQQHIAFCPAQLDALRGQMAALGKVMTVGLREVNKIQDSLCCTSSTSTVPVGKS